MSANVKQVVPFLWVINMEASISYYVDRLGFELVNRWIDDGKLRWCWLKLGGAAIMLQEYKQDHIPEIKRGEGVSICFQCEDALAIYSDALSKGIEAREPFVGNNMWVTIMKDPDGYVLDFESSTDVPEETRLSELGGV
jgi:lactoylglutathione lyase